MKREDFDKLPLTQDQIEWVWGRYVKNCEDDGIRETLGGLNAASIINSFCFDKTQEGGRFWAGIYNNLNGHGLINIDYINQEMEKELGNGIKGFARNLQEKVIAGECTLVDEEVSDICVEESLIDTRQKTHGDYKSKCEFIQPTKAKMRQAPNWETLPNHQKESLDLIATKIGRILYGDPAEKDHWADISGYAELGKGE